MTDPSTFVLALAFIAAACVAVGAAGQLVVHAIRRRTADPTPDPREETP